MATHSIVTETPAAIWPIQSAPHCEAQPSPRRAIVAPAKGADADSVEQIILPLRAESRRPATACPWSPPGWPAAERAAKSHLQRSRGSLWGLAVGNALGAAVEGQLPGAFDPIADFRGGGPYGLSPGQWTSDTSLALALADSIAAAGWNPSDQMRRYIAWWRGGAYTVNGSALGVEIEMEMALRRFQESGDPQTSGNTAEENSSNGSLVRLAPVAIRYATAFPHRLEELISRLVDSSLPTHASPQCLSACAYFGLLLSALLRGVPREEVLDPRWPPLVRLRDLYPLHDEVNDVAGGSFRRLEPPAIVGSSYVVKSLEAALWAFCGAASFRHAVLRAVNLGDDADTIGALCGQLAGAYWSDDAIPAGWQQSLVGGHMLDLALTRLLESPCDFT